MEPNNSKKRKKRQLRVLENARDAMGCYLYLSACVAVVTIIIALVLFATKKVMPELVEGFEFTADAQVIIELKDAHKYKAATYFYELNKDRFQKRGDRFIILTEVADCYIYVGEYVKAEELLKSIYDLDSLSGSDNDAFSDMPIAKDIVQFHAARELLKLYENTGDKTNQRKYANILKGFLSDAFCNEYDRLMRTVLGDDTFVVKDLLVLDEIKILYLDNPEEAISRLHFYIMNLETDKSKKPEYVLKCYNTYLNWVMEHNGIMTAYPLIGSAVKYAESHYIKMRDWAELGRLSDNCYSVQDTVSSKFFYDLCTEFFERERTHDDPEFIKNRVRGFKYLETSGQINKLTDDLINCCEDTKTVFLKNIPVMTELQREYLVELLGGLFDYAASILYNNPNPRLARLCLDNSLYMKGLLLRSNRELSAKINKTHDEILIRQYQELIDYRKELLYLESRGTVANSFKVSILKNRINDIDKTLTTSFDEYSASKTKSVFSTNDLLRALSNNDAYIDFIQTKDSELLAIVAKSDGTIDCYPLGRYSDVSNILMNDSPRTIYSQRQLTDCVWPDADFHNVQNIYYSTNGIFNSIAFYALSIEGGEHLIDRYSFHLLSQGANIVDFSNHTYSLADSSTIAIWGDIDYGKTSEAILTGSVYRAIVRGEGLKRLIFSEDEVNSIARIASSNNSICNIFTKENATEYSFRQRSGQHDAILHVSTHGFFDEDDYHRRYYDPMYNSGILFAGADSTWRNDSIEQSLKKQENDGILRASDIQFLDFSDCRLAVLSACKTGLGKSKNIEGVYGLQRAFKLSGVDKIVMSLWNVDDYSTAKLMEYFYNNLYKGLSDEEALREAQMQARRELGSPDLWGGFVLMY